MPKLIHFAREGGHGRGPRGVDVGYNVVDVNPTGPTTVPAFRAKWMSFGITATLYL